MSLYDIIGDISQKQVTKTETGDERIFGVMIGTVTRNYDQSMGGRVCVSIPTRDQNANELHWARLVQPASGKELSLIHILSKPFAGGCADGQPDQTGCRTGSTASWGGVGTRTIFPAQRDFPSVTDRRDLP